MSITIILSVTIQFGNAVGQSIIAKVSVPNSMLNQLYLGGVGGIDTKWFPSGTLTVPYEMLDAFNQAVAGSIQIMPQRGDLMNETSKFKTIFEQDPDVEAFFEFNGTRMGPVYNRYSPNHLVNDAYLTSGVHYYYDVTEVHPNGIAKGTITFLSPEAYPGCLWVGKKISIQEGERIVGYATITKIFNSILEAQEHN